MNKKKVLIDVTSTIPIKKGYIGGIGKSTYWLLNTLNTFPSEKSPFEIELCACGIIPIPRSLKIFNENISCIWRNKLLNYDLYHIPGIVDYVKQEESIVATFHDLDAYDLSKDLKFRQWHENIAHQCRGIVCCSQYSRNEVAMKMGVDFKKIDMIYWGCDFSTFKQLPADDIAAILSKYNIQRPYFFTCSCTNPRKNVETALAAFRKFLMYNPKHIFVLVWGNPRQDIVKEYAQEISTGKIRFLPFVSDNELVALYNGASMSIYVTRKEGFGFPILESFACGTPVMTCRNSCLEEVGKDAAIYVGEDDTDEMANVMLKIERDAYDMNAFIVSSGKILSEFSWEKCAEKYIAFFSKNLTFIR